MKGNVVIAGGRPDSVVEASCTVPLHIGFGPDGGIISSSRQALGREVVPHGRDGHRAPGGWLLSTCRTLLSRAVVDCPLH